MKKIDPYLKKIFTIEEFCAVYNICKKTYYNLARENNLPIRKKIKRKVFIRIEDADRWYEQLKQQ